MKEGKVVAINPDGTIDIEDTTGLYRCQLGVREDRDNGPLSLEFFVSSSTQVAVNDG